MSSWRSLPLSARRPDPPPPVSWGLAVGGSQVKGLSGVSLCLGEAINSDTRSLFESRLEVKGSAPRMLTLRAPGGRAARLLAASYLHPSGNVGIRIQKKSRAVDNRKLSTATAGGVEHRRLPTATIISAQTEFGWGGKLTGRLQVGTVS